MQELEKSIGVLPKRPGLGTVGIAQSDLLANYFTIDLEPKVMLYQYQVIFKPEPKNALATKYTIKRLFEEAEFRSSRIATDYATILVTSSPLFENGRDGGSGVLTPEHTSKKARQADTAWTISLVATHDINTILGEKGPKEAVLRAFNLVISRKPAADFENITMIKGNKGIGGNKFFDMGKEGQNLDWFLRGYRGYYSSVRATSGGLLLNVNAVAAAFVTPGDAIELENWINYTYDKRDKNKHIEGTRVLANRVKGLQVQFNQPPPQHENDQSVSRQQFRKVVRCLAGWPENATGLTAETATFDWEQDGQIHPVTVQEYFRKSKCMEESSIDVTILMLCHRIRQNPSLSTAPPL